MKFSIFLVSAIFYLLFAMPGYATHDPTCTDPNDLACKTCPEDEFGDHHVNTTWDGECSTTLGKRVRFACDHTGRTTTIGEVDDPRCDATPLLSPAPVGPIDIKKVFGEIQPPDALLPFIQKGGSGTGGISLFLSNLIALIYVIATIVFVIMIVWGAFEWLSSGGEKERISSAQRRLTHALIGIVLFAVIFAVLNLIGTFTGFTFFTSVTRPGCTQRDEYYIDRSTNQCIHKFFSGPECTAIFRPVEKRFCP